MQDRLDTTREVGWSPWQLTYVMSEHMTIAGATQ